MSDTETEISQRFKEFRKAEGLSQQELADALGVTQPYIASIEAGRSNISNDIMRFIRNHYNVNLDWLVTGLGSLKASVLSNASDRNRNVIMVPVSAQAGILGNWSQEWVDQNLSRTSLPGIEKEAFAFEVAGESMVPTIHPGDYVVGEKLASGADIVSTRVHIIISKSSGIYIKRVYVDKNFLILESDNDAFPPVTLPFDDVHEVYYAIQRLTWNFSGPRPFTSRLDKIEDYLAKRFPDFPILWERGDQP